MTDVKPTTAPSRLWYLAGVLIWIAGCGASLGIGLSYGSGKIESMERVVIPGERTMELTAGDYTGFYEQKSTVDGAMYVGPDSIAGVRCGVVNTATREPVAIEPAGSSMTYSFGSYAGASMFEFTVPTTATYLVGCDYEGEPIVIAIGQGVGMLILYILAFAFAAFIIGTILIIAIYRKRRRANS